jgi:hypothetical protein
VFGVLHTVQAALPQLIARRGAGGGQRSVASLGHAPGMSAYAASKSAVEAMCDSWRIKLAHHGIDVTCIHPLWVTTPLVERGRQSGIRAPASGDDRALARETSLDAAAALIAAGILARRRRVFVPGWVRWLFVLRSLLHTRPLERDQLAAAQELEALYLDDVQRGLVAPLPPSARPATAGSAAAPSPDGFHLRRRFLGIRCPCSPTSPSSRIRWPPTCSPGDRARSADSTRPSGCSRRRRKASCTDSAACRQPCNATCTRQCAPATAQLLGT